MGDDWEDDRICSYPCAECGEQEEEFDEEGWDDTRQVLENSIEVCVEKLSEFMGCNSFTLPFDNFTVKVTPK